MRQTYLNNARQTYLNGYPPVPAGSGFGQYDQAAAGFGGSPDGLGYYIKNAMGADDAKAAAEAPMPADGTDKNIRLAVGLGLGAFGIYMTYRFFKKRK